MATKKLITKKKPSSPGPAVKPVKKQETVNEWGVPDTVGVIDHFIPLATAKEYVKRFGEKAGTISKGNYMQPENFSKAAIKAILDLPGCVQLRVYFGLNKFNKVRLVLVGADARHNDLYIKRMNPAGPSKPNQRAMTEAMPAEDGAVDLGQMCPAYAGDIVTLF